MKTEVLRRVLYWVERHQFAIMSTLIFLLMMRIVFFMIDSSFTSAGLGMT